MSTPLILIHGVGLDRHIWSPFRAAYQGETYAYDLRGHGDGPLWQNPASLAQFAADLDNIIAQNGAARVNLCGFSMGAMIALYAAGALGAKIRRLILLASVFTRNAAQRARIEKSLKDAQQNGLDAMIDAALARWFPPDFPSRYTPYRATIRACLEHNDPRQFLHSYRLFAQADKTLPDLAKRVQQPCLIIAGGKDQNSTPVMAQKLQKSMPNADYIVYADTAHMIPLHNPERLATDIAQFLCKEMP